MNQNDFTEFIDKKTRKINFTVIVLNLKQDLS